MVKLQSLVLRNLEAFYFIGFSFFNPLVFRCDIVGIMLSLMLVSLLSNSTEENMVGEGYIFCPIIYPQLAVLFRLLRC
jgi:hypothetical protein